MRLTQAANSWLSERSEEDDVDVVRESLSRCDCVLKRRPGASPRERCDLCTSTRGRHENALIGRIGHYVVRSIGVIPRRHSAWRFRSAVEPCRRPGGTTAAPPSATGSHPSSMPTSRSSGWSARRGVGCLIFSGGGYLLADQAQSHDVAQLLCTWA